MKTIMQPIRTIWNKFPRVVRDTVFTLEKQVQLEMEDEETELDKTLIEAIANPLTHLVRNCLDRGIGTSEVRAAKGKPAVGRLLLRASHESGQVNIEISDDGGGIDPDRIRSKAVQKVMFSAVDAAKMSDCEALNFIFMPSFSTAEKIINISGRGVGMDVVQTNMEKISGTIVHSQIGKGTIFKLKILLTLAIIPTLIITTGGDRIAQQTNMTEAQEKAILADENSRRESSEPAQQLLVIQGPDCRRMAIHLSRVCRLEEFPRHLLERVGKQDVVQYRHQIMPMIYLSAVFGSDGDSANSAPNGFDGRSPSVDDKLPLVVVSIGSEHQVGFVVDRILDIVEQSIDIKGAATQAGISYCAVIQGQVTEILDVDAVISDNLFGLKQMLATAI